MDSEKSTKCNMTSLRMNPFLLCLSFTFDKNEASKLIPILNKKWRSWLEQNKTLGLFSDSLPILLFCHPISKDDILSATKYSQRMKKLFNR